MFGWFVRLCLKTLLWFVQIESANRFFVVEKFRYAPLLGLFPTHIPTHRV
jgi:hypothetical protein